MAHFVGTYKDNILRGYYDGELIDEKYFPGNIYTSNANIRIGAPYNPSSGHYLNGTIDEVTLYAKSLISSEVKQLYEAQKAKAYEELLVEGIKEVDVSLCTLERGQPYNVFAVTNNLVIDQKIVPE